MGSFDDGFRTRPPVHSLSAARGPVYLINMILQRAFLKAAERHAQQLPKDSENVLGVTPYSIVLVTRRPSTDGVEL